MNTITFTPELIRSEIDRRYPELRAHAPRRDSSLEITRRLLHRAERRERQGRPAA